MLIYIIFPEIEYCTDYYLISYNEAYVTHIKIYISFRSDLDSDFSNIDDLYVGLAQRKSALMKTLTLIETLTFVRNNLTITP